LVSLFAKVDRELAVRISILSGLRKRRMSANNKYNVNLNIWRGYDGARCSGNVHKWSLALAVLKVIIS